MPRLIAVKPALGGSLFRMRGLLSGKAAALQANCRRSGGTVSRFGGETAVTVNRNATRTDFRHLFTAPSVAYALRG
jgi:hypothetical protein